MRLDIPEIEVKICTHSRLGKVPRSHQTCDEDSVEQVSNMAICEGLRGGVRHIESGQEPEDRESEWLPNSGKGTSPLSPGVASPNDEPFQPLD